jgi:hypothetical protein
MASDVSPRVFVNGQSAGEGPFLDGGPVEVHEHDLVLTEVMVRRVALQYVASAR